MEWESLKDLETGYFVKPTIFADVNNQMTVARTEIFGPVLSMIPFDTEEEAIAIANDTPYGLDQLCANSWILRKRNESPKNYFLEL